MGALGLIEVLDRDGQPRQSLPVQSWPLRIGRALDNDLVLSDPHVAAHHAVIAPVAEPTDMREPGDRLALTVGTTRNGLGLAGKRLREGEQAALPADGDPLDLLLGRTHLRLRLPGHTLAPEQSLAPAGSYARRTVPMLVAALILVAGTLFGTYLGTDPDGLGRAAGTALISGLVGAAVWCTIWALLSKTFTRQARFGWHLRVFLAASVALMAIGALLPLLAYAFSWPWATDFDFVPVIAVLAAALYYHLLAVEPARHRILKWAATVCAVVGIGLSMWFNQQRTGQLGDELYMSHLFPPALRVARPLPVDRFADGLAALKPTLDKAAREPGTGDDAPRGEDE